MFDKKINKTLNPLLSFFSSKILVLNISSNQITFFGLIIGIISFIFLSLGNYLLALIFFLTNRLLDGIDGAVARKTKTTDLGGFYFFYIGGLTEGFETITFFCLMMIFPIIAPILAWIFGILCWITFLFRIFYISKLLK